VITIFAVLIAIVGHDFLHRVQRLLTVLSILAFGVLTVGALVNLHLGTLSHKGNFNLTGFLIMFSAATGYQISYAVYVSDYSRYLPRNTDAGRVIWWVYLGMAGSAIWLMCLGALIGWAFPSPDAITSVQQVGNGIIGSFDTLVVVLGAIGLATSMSMNGEGAMLTGVTAVDGFTHVTLKIRLLTHRFSLTQRPTPGVKPVLRGHSFTSFDPPADISKHQHVNGVRPQTEDLPA